MQTTAPGSALVARALMAPFGEDSSSSEDEAPTAKAQAGAFSAAFATLLRDRTGVEMRDGVRLWRLKPFVQRRFCLR